MARGAGMFGILLSALRTSSGFVLRAVVMKFGGVFVLWYILQEMWRYILPHIGSAAIFQTVINLVPDGSIYWINLMAVPQGVPLVIAAMSIRFLIRRIPLLG